MIRVLLNEDAVQFTHKTDKWGGTRSTSYWIEFKLRGAWLSATDYAHMSVRPKRTLITHSPLRYFRPRIHHRMRSVR